MPSPDEHDMGNTVLTTAEEQEIDDEVRPKLQMIVIGKGTFATHALPETGRLTIGRNASCELAIEDKSISRRHAVLSLGDRLTIEDVGSANGTRVRGAAVKRGHPMQIAVGELVSLGKVNIILQQRPTTRRLLTQADFGSRLEEECSRTRRSGAAFALLHVEPEMRASANVEVALNEILRETDVFGKHGPHAYRVLLLDCPSENADNAARRIADKLRQRDHKCRIVVACYPRDAGTAQQLLGCLHPPATRDKPTVRANASADIVITDPAMQSLHQLIEQVAGSRIGVLLLGETGVGKEVFARAVHRVSQRAAGPFVELNCAALTETLLESELFGHEKGAFTHATSAKPGLLETADGGTILLDEIGDMPLSTQAKLLRVIEDSQLRRVGALKPRTIDVRFVAATNIDLEARIEAGRFRRDLYYRLNGVTVMIPPLRERPTEIEPLATVFIDRAWGREGTPASLAAETLELMKRYDWPGNIRELKFMIERAVLLCGSGPIMPEHLPERLRTFAASARSAPELAAKTPAPSPHADGVDEERQIIEALARTHGNQTAAARLLGISRRTLVNRLNAYKQILRPRKGKKTPQ